MIFASQRSFVPWGISPVDSVDNVIRHKQLLVNVWSSGRDIHSQAKKSGSREKSSLTHQVGFPFDQRFIYINLHEASNEIQSSQWNNIKYMECDLVESSTTHTPLHSYSALLSPEDGRSIPDNKQDVLFHHRHCNSDVVGVLKLSDDFVLELCCSYYNQDSVSFKTCKLILEMWILRHSVSYYKSKQKKNPQKIPRQARLKTAKRKHLTSLPIDLCGETKPFFQGFHLFLFYWRIVVGIFGGFIRCFWRFFRRRFRLCGGQAWNR